MRVLLSALALVGLGACSSSQRLEQTRFQASGRIASLDGGSFAGYLGEATLAPADKASVRFVVVGDVGKATAEQKAVAEMLHGVCGSDGKACDFMLFPGDNLYDYGIEADPAKTPQHASIARLTAILGAYPPTPKCLVLGNHDWGLSRRNVRFGEWQMQVLEQQREALNVKCHSFFVRASAGPVKVWGIDTEYLAEREGAHEEPDLQAIGAAIAADGEAIRQAGRGWQVVFGHHAYLSTGVHGDAGRYEGLPPRGANVEAFLDRWVIGRSQLYVAGHDHHLEFYDRARATPSDHPTALLISGAGAKCRPMRVIARKADKPRPVYLAQRFGFTVIEATAERMVVEQYEYAAQASGAPQPAWRIEGAWVDGKIVWTERGGQTDRVSTMKAAIETIYANAKAFVTQKECER